MYYVKNEEAKHLPCKIKPFRDSTDLYIPYKLTIYNNRLKSLKFLGIYDGWSYGRLYGKSLFYNLDNLELYDFSGESKNLKEEDNYNKYGNDTYWRIGHIFKYKKNIFPFFGRDFYYYKRYTLSNKNDRFNLKQILRDSIKKQLYTLDYNLNVDIKKSIIDSLYRISNKKRFNISFETKSSLVTKKIRAKINSSEQEAVYVNLNDSIIGMSKKEQIDYLTKYMKQITPIDSF